MRATNFADIKVFLISLVIAALVWIYAEGQSLATRALNVPISVSAEPAGGVAVIVNDPAFKGAARVRLEGSSRTIDDAAAQLGAAIRIMPGMPGVPVEPGESRSIDLREAISALPELAGLGSSVAGVDPRYVNVRVVQLVTRELPVRVELPAQIALDGDPVSNPASVSVSLPADIAAALPDGAFVIAQVPEADVQRLRADGPETFNVQLRPPVQIANVSPMGLSPAAASVTLRARRAVDVHRLASVPIWYSLPPTEDAGRWSVEMIDKFLTDVSVSGSSEQVRRIREGQVAVKAVLELSSEDLEKSVGSKAVVLTGLPPGVTATIANPEARVRITRRQPGAPREADSDARPPAGTNAPAPGQNWPVGG